MYYLKVDGEKRFNEYRTYNQALLAAERRAKDYNLVIEIWFDSPAGIRSHVDTVYFV